VSKEEESLKSYLLGRLPEREQIKIEERLLLDSDYVELLQIVEEQLIDGYARGRLPEDERKELDESLARSPALRRKLIMSRPFTTHADQWQPPEGRRPSESLWERWLGFWRLLAMRTFAPAWRMAVWAALMLAGGVAAWQVFLYQSLADKAHIALQDSFNESPIEGRIAGFKWPPHRATLGGQSGAADEISLDRAKVLSQEAVAARGNADSHRALGQYYLANKELDKAIRELDKALESDSKNAELHSDLGTAYLERARAAQEKAGGDKSPEDKDTSLQDFDQCLKHLNEALKLDGSLLEALFNIALCHEYMSLLPQAELDWQDYLKRDGASAWAAEARRHIEQIEEKKQKNSQSNADLLKEFREAYATNDRQAAWKLVSENRELVKGRVIWWQLLNDYFDQASAGNASEAKERLNELEYVGNLDLSLGSQDERQTGDRYISELVSFYLNLPFARVSVLGDAHRRINDGNQLFENQSYDRALESYQSAGQIFGKEDDQWEVLLADDLISYCHIQKGEMDRGGSLVRTLVAQCAARRYSWLLARNLFALAMVQDREAEHSEALESTRKALQISNSIADAYDTQRSLSQIADQYKKLGNYESATAYINLCLKQMGTHYPGRRQVWRNFNQLAQILAAQRLNDAAVGYAQEALNLALLEQDAGFSYVSYVDLALLRSKQRRYAEAINLAQNGLEVAPNLPEPRVYASLQLGNLHRQAGDVIPALDEYNRCIKYIQGLEDTGDNVSENWEAKKDGARPSLWLYTAHKGRLFCLLENGSDTAVEEELRSTLGLLGKYRRNILEEQNRNTFFDLEQTVYDAAMDFAYSRRADYQAVFDYSEQSRARSLLDLMANAPNAVGNEAGRDYSQVRTLSQVREALPDETQLIEYAALENKLLICLVSRSEFSVKETPIRLDELTDKVLRFRQSILTGAGLEAEEIPRIRAQAQELYHLLIEPISLSPTNGSRICLVPDKILNNLPFAALVSPGGRRYLVEDYVVTLAPSATVYLVCSENRNHRAEVGNEHLLAVANPAFDRSVFPELSPLQSTEVQVDKIAKLYSANSPVVLTGAKAAKEPVKDEMQKADVIHLASHYKVYPGQPMNSRLLLAKSLDQDVSKGFLQADEVYGLRLHRAPLVVLSACDSGVEYYYNGEGLIGMSRVFIAAGAPVVVASLWQVETAATSKLMVGFHQHRKSDRNPTGEALALAQRDMLSGALGEDHRHPYYWAGFTAIGGATTF
jgi:CHAT domain-containing protein